MYKMHGIIPAMVTPFNMDYSIDEKGSRELVRFLINGGVHCILVGGSTGEYTLMSKKERKMIIRIAVEEANEKVPIMAGTGYHSTEETIELTRYAADVGADSVLIITPHYLKPTNEGLITHYKKITEGADIPIVIYHWPEGTGVFLLPEIVGELSRVDGIVGIKNTAPQEHTNTLINMFQDRDDFAIVTGLESLLLSTLACGGSGGIGVVYNIIPRESVKLYKLMVGENNFEEAKKLHNKFMPLFNLIFREPSPAPIKAALSLMGLPAGPTRLPILSISDSLKEELKNMLKDLNII
ncbi:4-hydroxy-tetrahydrodipicolinate synthase [Candidatus Atribacteria bacterium HGW-Atribacteria-1]|nr:MAG: 4-hydroxy-tetrahydrodipicolinate synthase [Candidatus Atribacteria bacterium HGW-Atribacteria-1]